LNLWNHCSRKLQTEDKIVYYRSNDKSKERDILKKNSKQANGVSVSANSLHIKLVKSSFSPCLSCHCSLSSNREHLQLVHDIQDASSKKVFSVFEFELTFFPMHISKALWKWQRTMVQEKPGILQKVQWNAGVCLQKDIIMCGNDCLKNTQVQL